MVTIKRYDNGQYDVSIERYGYSHLHRNVTRSSIDRLSQVCKQYQSRKLTRNVTHILTTIKL